MKIVVLFTNIKRLLYILTVAFLGVCFWGFYPNIFIWPTIGCLLSGMLLAVIFSPRLGTPCNEISPEKIINSQRIATEITVVETGKGIYQIQDGNYDTILDMHNWLLRTKYVTDIITTFLSLESYNKSEQSAYSLPYGKQRYKNENLTIQFLTINGKTKRKTIVENYQIKKSFAVRVRLRLSLKGIKGSSREYRNTNHYEFKMSDCYAFKK